MQQNSLIQVVTGEKGSGKSTVCARVAREAAKGGLRVGGILTERSGGGDPRASRQVVDLSSGESRPFGSEDRGPCRRNRHRPRPEDVAQETGTSDPLTPGWDFDSGVFAWANEVLSRSIPCDLLVIDELGPLELLGGRGWASALAILRSRAYGAALVVCRPKLLGVLRERLDPLPTTLCEVTLQGRDDLPAAILEVLQAHQDSGHDERTKPRRTT